MEKTALIAALNRAMDRLTDASFAYHGNTRPLLFVQEPYQGTVAMLYLKDVHHPSDTVKCMDVVYEELTRDGDDVCVVANDLTTLEICI